MFAENFPSFIQIVKSRMRGSKFKQDFTEKDLPTTDTRECLYLLLFLYDSMPFFQFFGFLQVFLFQLSGFQFIS